MWRLAIRFMLLLVVAIPITAESSLDHTGITLFEEQSNYPELSESVAPTSGNPWTWTASSFSGFSGSPTIWFDYQDGDHTIARLHWSGFVASDWQNGVDGSFTLTLSNGVEEDRVYSVDLSLRCFIGEGFTWFKQQTGGSDCITAAGAEGFVMLKTGSTGLPGDLSLTFNAMGAVTACASSAASWTEDGTINLAIADGTRPASNVNGWPVSLRSLVGDGFTWFKQQTGGSDCITAAGANGFIMLKTGSTGLPGDLSLTFNAMGAVISCSSSGASWTEDGTMNLAIADGSRPSSNVIGWPVSLRSLVGDGFTWFKQQTGGSDCITAAGANGFIMLKTGSTGLPGDLSLTFNAMGAVTACAATSATWTEDGTINLIIADGGSRPASTIFGWPVSLRSLVGDGFTWFKQQTGGSDCITAAGANGFIMLKTGSTGLPGDLSLTFNAMGAVTACAATSATWTEDGTINLIIADGGSRPASTIFGWPVSLRSLVGDGFTWFKQQTGGSDCITAAGANGFIMLKTGSTGLPSDLSLTFNAMGAVTACASAAGAWTEDGSINLMIADGGSRPASIVQDWPVSLRSLVGEGYTLFEQQTDGGDGFTAAGANGFVTLPTGSTSLPGDLSLTFDPMGAVTACASAIASWTEDGSINLIIADGGSRPASIINGWPVSLRSLVGEGYTLFEQQTDGGDGFTAAGANGFVTLPTGSTSLPGDLSLTFDPMGAVTACASAIASWTEDGSIDIMIADGGSRPVSIVHGWPVSLRQITPTPFAIPNDGSEGSVNLTVNTDSGPWDWSDYIDGLVTSILTAPNTGSSSSLTVSWLAGDLLSGESGTGAVIIRKSDESAPYSTVNIPTVVEEATCCNKAGDANSDGNCNIGDAVYINNHVFRPGQCLVNPPIGCPPDCRAEGDANADGNINIGDAVYLNNHVFRPDQCIVNPPIGCPPDCGTKK